MMNTYQGLIVTDLCEVRFAYSGKIASVNKRLGDSVKKNEMIATLDRSTLQTELDRQLKEYEGTRADFELFLQKIKDEADTTKYLKDAKQAELDRAVKDVELAKGKLDQADLVSPVNGTVVDIEGLRPGLYVTPSNSPIKIIDSEMFRTRFDIPQDQLGEFLNSRRVKVKLPGIGKEYFGNTIPAFNGIEGTITIYANLEDTSGLINGLKGEVSGA